MILIFMSNEIKLTNSRMAIAYCLLNQRHLDYENAFALTGTLNINGQITFLEKKLNIKVKKLKAGYKSTYGVHVMTVKFVVDNKAALEKLKNYILENTSEKKQKKMFVQQSIFNQYLIDKS